jgi:phage terminase large subunit-like protein
MSPAGWAVRAVELYQARAADLIVAEKNHGGDMVEYTIKSVTRTPVPVKLLWASRGKAVRAQPVASLTEQGLVHMVGDTPFEELEHQLCSMTEDGYEGGGQEGESPSPDRLDAYVWAMTELMLGASLSRGIGVPGWTPEHGLRR